MEFLAKRRRVESDEEESEDCLEHILTYAGFDESQIEDVRNKIREYRELPDMLSTDDEAYRIRKQLTLFFMMYIIRYLCAQCRKRGR